jgi:hypothetical protein
MESKKAKIVACRPLPNYRMWLRFDDGLEGEKVQVDPETDTLTWGERDQSRCVGFSEGKTHTRLWTFLASPVPNTFSFFFEKREAVGEEPNLV